MKSAGFLSLVAVCMLTVPGLAKQADETGHVEKAFKDWRVSCSSMLCRAEVQGPDLGGIFGATRLVIQRLAKGDQHYRIDVISAVEDDDPRQQFRLAVDGQVQRLKLPVFHQQDRNAVSHYGILGHEDRARVIKALLQGRQAEARWKGSKPARFSLAGLSASLRWMDEQQGLAFTSKAFVATGKKAAPRRLLPAYKLSDSVQQAFIKRSIAIGDCLIDGRHAEVWAQRLDFGHQAGEGQVLVGVSCFRGAYNVSDRLFLYDPKAGVEEARLQVFAEPWGKDWTAVSQLFLPSLEPLTNLLTTFYKGRGLGDCGSQNTYVYKRDVEQFVLLEARVKPNCGGSLAAPGDFPVVFRRQ